MHPRRFGAFMGMVDSTNRPLMVIAANGPFNALGVINSSNPPFGIGVASGIWQERKWRREGWRPVRYAFGWKVWTKRDPDERTPRPRRPKK
jgi:hypothetical protein